jgi:hypothetical protein
LTCKYNKDMILILPEFDFTIHSKYQKQIPYFCINHHL